MRTTRGFKLGRKLSRWVIFRFKRKPIRYTRLPVPGTGSGCCESKTMTKIYNWGRSLKRGAKEFCSRKTGSLNYIRVNQEPLMDQVPKGHLAVYVGAKDDDPHRVFVPVIYFNHPLFGELLREAEKEYGYHQSGGISIPCPISEFQYVQMMIATGGKDALKHRV